MIKVAICDDEQIEIEKVYKLCEKIIKNNNLNCEISVFDKGKELLESKAKYDIVFLDIELGDVNGINVGGHLSKKNNSQIIYISNYPEYCIDAINKVHAFAFLKKPIDEIMFNEQIIATLSNIQQQLSEETIHFKIISIEYDEITKNIMGFRVKDIYYFEFVNRKIKLKMCDREYFFHGKMKDIQIETERYGFVRCHNAFVINLNHLLRISKNVAILDNNECIPISQRRASKLREKLNSYLHIKIKQ